MNALGSAEQIATLKREQTLHLLCVSEGMARLRLVHEWPDSIVVVSVPNTGMFGEPTDLKFTAGQMPLAVEAAIGWLTSRRRKRLNLDARPLSLPGREQ